MGEANYIQMERKMLAIRIFRSTFASLLSHFNLQESEAPPDLPADPDELMDETERWSTTSHLGRLRILS